MTSTIILALIVLILIIAVALLLSANRKAASESKTAIAEAASKSALLDAANATIAELRHALTDTSDQLRHASELLSATNAQNARLTEQIRITNEQRPEIERQSETRFQQLADKIFEDKTKKFKEMNETRIAEILTPFKDSISKFEDVIRKNHDDELKDREKLSTHIAELMKLNQTIGTEANNLTKALKGNAKTQGDWGEMILKDILDKCGLQENVEYLIQPTRDDHGELFKNDKGNLRPDVIVRFPGNKNLIIDSKVSLVAYVDYCNADDPQEQQQRLADHVTSVKNHINELTKGYQQAINDSADFVLMFISNEGAYTAAMRADNNLWKLAYDRQIIIISPTHLISILKLVEQLWRTDKQNRNAERMALETGRLYDKFAGFLEDMQSIENGINSTRKAFDGAMNKLKDGKGNILKRISDIKVLGGKTTKELPISPDNE